MQYEQTPVPFLGKSGSNRQPSGVRDRPHGAWNVYSRNLLEQRHSFTSCDAHEQYPLGVFWFRERVQEVFVVLQHVYPRYLSKNKSRGVLPATPQKLGANIKGARVNVNSLTTLL